MKTFLKSLIFFIIFVGILGASILGSLAPESVAVPLGKLQLSVFDNGLSLYQSFKGVYFVFSPFNDYVIENGKRISLIPKEDVEAKSYKTDKNTYPWTGILYSLESFTDSYTPQVTFKNGETISYSAKTDKNRLVLTRSITLPNRGEQKHLGSTITFNTNDFVFDKSGNLYNYVPDSNKEAFFKANGIALSDALLETEVTIPGKTIYIFSPKLAGVIAITASKNQTVKVNRNAKFVEIEELIKPANGVYTNSLNITIFNNPKEAFYGN